MQVEYNGLVVKFHGPSGQWRDDEGRNWSNGIRLFLPDLDVFEINASTLNETANFAHVGTINFNMAVNPNNGNIYVSNTEARNLTRFEGPGIFGGSTVQGSDLKDSFNLDRLRARNIRCMIGHDPANLDGASTLVISTAVKAGNPEFEAAKERGETPEEPEPVLRGGVRRNRGSAVADDQRAGAEPPDVRVAGQPARSARPGREGDG